MLLIPAQILNMYGKFYVCCGKSVNRFVYEPTKKKKEKWEKWQRGRENERNHIIQKLVIFISFELSHLFCLCFISSNSLKLEMIGASVTSLIQWILFVVFVVFVVA